MPTALQPLRAAATRLRLRGRVDAHVAPDVDARLALADGRDVALDLTDVPFLDGAALEVLVAHRRRLAGEGRSLRIASASTAVAVIVELAAAAGILPDAGLLDAAVPTGAGAMAVAA